MFIAGVNNIEDKLLPVSRTPVINLSPVWLTLAINPCQGFSVISGVVDTGNKFIIGVNDTGKQLSLVTMTPVNTDVVVLSPVINLLLVTRTRTPWSWGAAKDSRKFFFFFLFIY
jgi:hypothetical protein